MAVASEMTSSVMTGSVMTRFGVKNYKCLKEVDIPLTPIHVIIGQNDAGKTSLLEAMLAFFRSSQKQLLHAFPGKWKGTELVFEDAATPIVELNGTFRLLESGKQEAFEFGYGLQVGFSGEPRMFEEWSYNVKDGTKVSLKELNPGWTKISQMGSQPIRRGEAIPYGAMQHCLRLAHLYQLDPKVMAMPATIDSNRKFRMDPDGFGLASLLDDLLGYAPERFIELRKRFCDYFPQFQNVRLQVEDAVSRNYDETGVSSTGRGSGKGIYFETRHGRSIRAQQASDGAILFLGFLAITSLPEPPKLILIEEPEKGVYPKRLEEIVKLLREVVAGTPESSRPQLILSTHSPYLLSFFAPEEVTLMSRQAGGGVIARPLRDAPNIKERMDGEFYLGELWYNLTEEELFGGVA
jgi:predicted ATPase